MSEQKPMSDERLAFLHKVHDQTPGSLSDLSKAEVGALLAEVDRLRAALAEANRETFAATVERPGATVNAILRAEKAEARLARVKALHRRVYPDYGVPEEGDVACNQCRTDDGGYEMWPCATIRALEGATDE